MAASSGVTTSTGRPIAIDLYAGAGGLSLGMEQAGFDVLAAAELDPIHALTHRFNLPQTAVLCRDLSDEPVLKVASALIEAAKASAQAHHTDEPVELDAVVGGPPCQGFSVGGVRDAEDERNGQFLRFVDLVVALQPKVFLLENVAGLLEPRFESLRKEALRRLTVDGGYEVTGFDEAVSAVDFGVPQRRRRVLVMGSRIGDAPSLMADETAAKVTVGDALAGLPSLRSYFALLSTDQVPLKVDDLARLRGARSTYARILAAQEIAADDFSWPRVYNDAVLTNSLRTVHKSKSVQRFRNTPQGGVEKISRLYRLDPETQARTLRAGTGSDRGSHTSPRPIHPENARVITVREAARLHGYPDWFRFHGTNWHGHRQVGNSVPPPLAAAAGRALVEALGSPALSRPTEAVKLGDPEWLWMGRTEAVEELARLAGAQQDAATKPWSTT
ncbi:DNA cytosine methyltransferase [Nocardioides sp. HM23]|uniref:DNA cytosine methyltransferase n=1 Tax=Nocardioides bizhenqiangii TaxID=3095076 RepID=UPI002ACA69C4|nr:DNA cytosine methyltransferase [Nocardioides sp. HM23]MDZ5622052.1 DNA cytosine methyltransferase [Nocardioides sp. HM23]